MRSKLVTQRIGDVSLNRLNSGLEVIVTSLDGNRANITADLLLRRWYRPEEDAAPVRTKWSHTVSSSDGWYNPMGELYLRIASRSVYRSRAEHSVARGIVTIYYSAPDKYEIARTSTITSHRDSKHTP